MDTVYRQGAGETSREQVVTKREEARNSKTDCQ